MGGVRTPIIGTPRPSPRHRRAENYTLNCEEPVIVDRLYAASWGTSDSRLRDEKAIVAPDQNRAQQFPLRAPGLVQQA